MVPVNKVAHENRRRLPIVGNNVADVARPRAPVQKDDTAPIGDQLQHALFVRTNRRVNEAIHALLEQSVDVGGRFIHLVARVTDSHGVAGLASLLLYALGKLWIEGVRDVANQQGDGPRVACDQRAGHSGWPVTELLDDAANPTACLVADIVSITQHPRAVETDTPADAATSMMVGWRRRRVRLVGAAREGQAWSRAPLVVP